LLRVALPLRLWSSSAVFTHTSSTLTRAAVVVAILVLGILVAFIVHRRSKRSPPVPAGPRRPGNDLYWDHSRQTVTLSSGKASQWDEPATTGQADLEQGTAM
jgi:hypothetical protein